VERVRQSCLNDVTAKPGFCSALLKQMSTCISPTELISLNHHEYRILKKIIPLTILQHLLFMSAIYLIYMLCQKEFRMLHAHLETGSKIFIIMDIDFIIWILFGQAKNKLCVFATICVCTSLSMYLRGQSFDMFHVLPAQVPSFLAA